MARMVNRRVAQEPRRRLDNKRRGTIGPNIFGQRKDDVLADLIGMRGRRTSHGRRCWPRDRRKIVVEPKPERREKERRALQYVLPFRQSTRRRSQTGRRTSPEGINYICGRRDLQKYIGRRGDDWTNFGRGDCKTRGRRKTPLGRRGPSNRPGGQNVKDRRQAVGRRTSADRRS